MAKVLGVTKAVENGALSPRQLFHGARLLWFDFGEPCFAPAASRRPTWRNPGDDLSPEQIGRPEKGAARSDFFLVANSWSGNSAVDLGAVRQ